jgi:hypothetical protein
MPNSFAIAPPLVAAALANSASAAMIATFFTPLALAKLK